MNIWRSLNGMLRLELVCADMAFLLTQIAEAKIYLFQLEQIDDLTARCSIERGSLKQLGELTARCGGNIKIIRRFGAYWRLKSLLKRPAFVGGLGFLLFLAAFLPTRIFFVEVEGNDQVAARQIIEHAAACGIRFGASRRAVRSEQMKNALIAAIPELQWAGVNTAGCTATISVREKTSAAEDTSSNGVSRIVAARDGVIESCTVIRGNRVCSVGQAVKKGDILVSGYTDCGLCIRAERAEAEIYAQTERKLTIQMLSSYQKKVQETDSCKKYSLIIGKKRINFYNGSGISDVTCVKMYKEYSMTLPGGFQLPVKLVEETWTGYESVDGIRDEADAQKVMSDYASRYLNQQMTAGSVLKQEEFFSTVDSLFQLDGTYACLEMIGQEQSEEIYQQYGKTD